MKSSLDLHSNLSKAHFPFKITNALKKKSDLTQVKLNQDTGQCQLDVHVGLECF